MDYKSVSKPSRYVGGEYGMPSLNENAAVKFCMCFPDAYEVGMSNLGTRILYYLLNNLPDVLCERCYAPWQDCGDLLRKTGEKLVSIDTKRPLTHFDFVGFSLQYELSYSNVLYMLDLAGIPFYYKDRKEEDPIIIMGGPCVVNPLPVMPFADIVNVGEGEITLPKICETYKKLKAEGKSKREILIELDKIDGCICPPLYEDKEYKKVSWQKVYDLDNEYFPHTALVPNLEIVHDRAVMELFRGCANGCRFCQAGFIYRPVRERSVENVYQTCCDLIKNTGYDELSLNSLSTSDYSGLLELVRKIRSDELFSKINIALPSLRLNSFDGEFADNNRKNSLTFAPEAGTQRLRDVINKNITEEDIMNSLTAAFKEGYSTVKLYFMIGLPTETMEDIEGIADLAIRIRELFFKTRTNKKDLRLNVSASIFIPKPFTPFQWESFDTLEKIQEKQIYLRDRLRAKNIGFAWHDWQSSLLEAVFARGDERLARVIELAYKNGAFMDGWAEFFNYEAYIKALEECNLDPWELTRGKSVDKPLEWDFVDVGVTTEFLKKERERAYSVKTTPSCIETCSACGLKCKDFPQRKKPCECAADGNSDVKCETQNNSVEEKTENNCGENTRCDEKEGGELC